MENIELRKIEAGDEQSLFDYFEGLSDDSKSLFGPHAFDLETITKLCHQHYSGFIGYLAIKEFQVIAYTIIVQGYIEHDLPRYENYNISLDHHLDYTLAPSVADAYQSKGIGTCLYKHIENDLRQKGVNRIVLWGGVQETNEKAVNFYKKHGFKELGRFEHNGSNIDMVKDL